jgi:hypothetical protein
MTRTSKKKSTLIGRGNECPDRYEYIVVRRTVISIAGTRRDSIAERLAKAQQQGAQMKSSRRIHLQQLDRSAPRGCESDKFCAIQREVFLPMLPARMKQRHNRSGGGIDTAQIRAFEQVTAVTRQGQI